MQQRRSIRLKDYDYATPGAYFVTVVTQRRLSLFGEIVDSEMRLNDAGRMVDDALANLQSFYDGVAVDTHIVMPNHVHILVVINDHVGAGLVPALGFAHAGQPQRVAPTRPSLADIVGRFKSWTANAYLRGVSDHAWPRFDTRLWQRNYYERVIRNDAEFDSVRRYVTGNPAGWANDRERGPL